MQIKKMRFLLSKGRRRATGAALLSDQAVRSAGMPREGKTENRFPGSPGKWIWPVTGFLALLWFLVRVIPKPSRAGYPCQRAAFPLASAFVLWLMGTLASWKLLRQARKLMCRGRIAEAGGLALLVLILFLILHGWQDAKPLQAGPVRDRVLFVPSEGSNLPMGEAKGVFPGRVVWVHNPAATHFNGSTGYWWSPENNDQSAVDAMLEQSILLLAGEAEIRAAWDRIFRWFNRQWNEDGSGYRMGEKVAVKLNMNTAGGHGPMGAAINTSPQITLSLARQLVRVVGIAETDLTFYDLSRYIPSSIFDPVREEFPGIRFVDHSGGDGREPFQVDSASRVIWSEPLTLENGGGNPTYLPRCVSEATYLINVGGLKGHELAGVTICAKNHVGTIIAHSREVPSHSFPKAAGIHPYACVHDFLIGGHWWFYGRPMGSYNSLTDLMGHRELGGKTLLYLADALYATQSQHSKVDLSQRWMSDPFNLDWTSSLLVSQDGVALESVGLDFLRSEPTMVNVYGNVDNYLHEAARADAPPSGTRYDPEGDGSVCVSLGAHEHWNDAAVRKYSRNLGTGEGVELVSLRMDESPPEHPSGLSVQSSGENQVWLTWHDGSVNEAYFEIERRDGEADSFEVIGSAGTDRVYFKDMVPEASGTYWYRCRALNRWGASAYSEEIAVTFSSTAIPPEGPVRGSLPEGFTFVPNPAKDMIRVACDQGIDRVELVDQQGKVVQYWEGKGALLKDCRLQGIPRGMYVVRITSAGRTGTWKLMVL